MSKDKEKKEEKTDNEKLANSFGLELSDFSISIFDSYDMKTL